MPPGSRTQVLSYRKADLPWWKTLEFRVDLSSTLLSSKGFKGPYTPLLFCFLGYKRMDNPHLWDLENPETLHTERLAHHKHGVHYRCFICQGDQDIWEKPG